MSTELTILAWTLVLAFIQIGLATMAAGRDRGMAYALGARDAPPPAESVMAGRLARAQRNMMETLPLFAAAVIVAHIAGREGVMTRWGAEAFFVGRIVYVPCYAFGVRYIRTLAWFVATIGLVLLLVAILKT